MTLVADESVDGLIVRQLRHDGHSVVYIAEVDPSIDDREVLQHSSDAECVLITADKDFGDLVFRQ